MPAMLARLAARCTIDVIAGLAIAALAITGVSPALAQHQRPVPASLEIPPEGIELPMAEFGGRPVVEVSINDEGPFRFILDTGADVSVIDTALSRSLGLSDPTSGEAPSAGAGHAPAVSIRELHVGDAILHGVIVAVMPLATLLVGPNAPRGVLSAASFPGYLISYDFRAKRIAIAEGALDAANASDTFQYLPGDDLPTVPITIGGREVRVHVDTGSASSLTLPARFLKELELVSEPRVTGKVKTPIGESECSSARLKGPVELGRFRLALDEVEFSDVRAGGREPVGQIGCLVLRDFVLTLDSSHRRIRFVQSE